MATALASNGDVEDVLGRDLTSDELAKVDAVLLKASELFRRESGQDFTAGTSTSRLKVDGGMVWLTQHPATAVSAAVNDAGDAVTYTRSGNWLTVDLASDQFVTVTYTHGGSVPDLVRLTIAEIAKRALMIAAPAAEGVTQRSETAGGLSESNSYAAWAVGGQTLLSPEDKALAQSYRFHPPRAHVMIP